MWVSYAGWSVAFPSPVGQSALEADFESGSVTFLPDATDFRVGAAGTLNSGGNGVTGLGTEGEGEVTLVPAEVLTVLPVLSVSVRAALISETAEGVSAGGSDRIGELLALLALVSETDADLTVLLVMVLEVGVDLAVSLAVVSEMGADSAVLLAMVSEMVVDLEVLLAMVSKVFVCGITRHRN